MLPRRSPELRPSPDRPGFLVDRLRRRLAEDPRDGPWRLSPPTRWAAKPTAASVRGMLAGAANLGRTSAQAGLDVDEATDGIRAKFGDDDEAAALALQAYTAACDAVELS